MTKYMRGPFGPDPMYDDRKPESYVSRPAPRVRPEAKHIATAQQGSIGFMLGVQGKAIGPSSWKKNEPPKDHFSENVRRMRQIQRKAKKKEREAQQPMKALWKSEKYATVQSKVADELQKEPPPPRPSSANFLRAHSRCGAVDAPRPASANNVRPRSRTASCSNAATRPPSPAKCSTPTRGKTPIQRANSVNDLFNEKDNVDWIKINGSSAKYHQVKRAPSTTALDDLKKQKEEEFSNYRRGVVPKYLQTRQQAWKEEKEREIANRPDPDCPPGHELMPKQDRLDTLQKLKQTEQQLTQELQSLPVRTDTLRVRTRKEEIERKLSEVEEAVKIFSRPKVFVKS